MRLYTEQPLTIIKKIEKNGLYICNPKKAENTACFKKAYDWLVKEMEKRIPSSEHPVYPVWAWYRYEGQRKPVIYENIETTPEPMYLLEIEIPDEQVVLSDFSNWHYVINDWYLNPYDTEAEWENEDKRFSALAKEEQEAEKKASWERIFQATSDTVQGTFWCLRKENIRKIEPVLRLSSELYEKLEDGEITFEEAARQQKSISGERNV